MGDVSSIGDVSKSVGGDDSRSQAVRILGRWRSQGFDTLLCYPSGYCSPANGRILRAPLPADYCVHAIDSEDALAKLAESIRSGKTYRL